MRADVPRPANVMSELVEMQVDYEAIGKRIAATAEHLTELFLRTQ